MENNNNFIDTNSFSINNNILKSIETTEITSTEHKTVSVSADLASGDAFPPTSPTSSYTTTNLLDASLYLSDASFYEEFNSFLINNYISEEFFGGNLFDGDTLENHLEDAVLNNNQIAESAPLQKSLNPISLKTKRGSASIAEKRLVNWFERHKQVLVLEQVLADHKDASQEEIRTLLAEDFAISKPAVSKAIKNWSQSKSLQIQKLMVNYLSRKKTPSDMTNTLSSMPAFFDDSIINNNQISDTDTPQESSKPVKPLANLKPISSLGKRKVIDRSQRRRKVLVLEQVLNDYKDASQEEIRAYLTTGLSISKPALAGTIGSWCRSKKPQIQKLMVNYLSRKKTPSDMTNTLSSMPAFFDDSIINNNQISPDMQGLTPFPSSLSINENRENVNIRIPTFEQILNSNKNASKEQIRGHMISQLSFSKKQLGKILANWCRSQNPHVQELMRDYHSRESRHSH